MRLGPDRPCGGGEGGGDPGIIAPGGAELGDMMRRKPLIGCGEYGEPDEFPIMVGQDAIRQRHRGIGRIIAGEQIGEGQRHQSVMRQQIAPLGAHRLQPPRQFAMLVVHRILHRVAAIIRRAGAMMPRRALTC